VFLIQRRQIRTPAAIACREGGALDLQFVIVMQGATGSTFGAMSHVIVEALLLQDGHRDP